MRLVDVVGISKPMKKILAAFIYVALGLVLAHALGAHTQAIDALALLALGTVVSDPVPNAQDGELPTGTFIATVLESGVPYIVNNFDFTENSTKVQSKSPRGKVARNKVVPTDTTGSCDVQLATELTTAPRPRATFMADADGDGNSEPYMVEKPGKTLGQDAEWKAKLSIFACANPLIYRTGDAATTGIAVLAPRCGALTISAIAVTGANAGDLFTAVAHGLLTGDRVTLKVTTGLTGLTDLTDYYVIKASADTFTLATSYANAIANTPVTFSADGTGFVSLGVDFTAALPRDVTLTAATWVGTGLPTGLAINATTGKISGKATAGAYPICKITVTGTITVDGVVENRTGVFKFGWTAS